MDGEVTVLVVDDDAAVRESLRWLIESAGMKVETYASAEAFLADPDLHRPGCLLLDVRMPGTDGLTLQKQLQDRRIELPVIIITGHADVAMAVKAMKNGAVDFVEKPFDDEALLSSIHRAIAQDTKVRAQTAERDEARERIRQLTHRERQVLDLVVRGCSNREVAGRLGIIDKTVEAHRANVKRKLRVDSLAQLVRLAMRAGI